MGDAVLADALIRDAKTGDDVLDALDNSRTDASSSQQVFNRPIFDVMIVLAGIANVKANP